MLCTHWFEPNPLARIIQMQILCWKPSRLVVGQYQINLVVEAVLFFTELAPNS
jgi:hypothetical protein